MLLHGQSQPLRIAHSIEASLLAYSGKLRSSHFATDPIDEPVGASTGVCFLRLGQAAGIRRPKPVNSRAAKICQESGLGATNSPLPVKGQASLARTPAKKDDSSTIRPGHLIHPGDSVSTT